MDEGTLQQLDQQTVLIVPTGTLATHLNEKYAAKQIQQGQSVWEAPNICSWSQVLTSLWRQNRALWPETHGILTTQQSKLLWTQVVEKSKRSDIELTLLNVQQTVMACMRSDRLLADWQCDELRLQQEHIDDLKQFLVWRDGYNAALKRRGVTDAHRLHALLRDAAARGELQLPFKRFIWYAYDLITSAQSSLIEVLIRCGAEVDYRRPTPTEPNVSYCRFESESAELQTVFQRARTLLEQNPERSIQIVVPDLQMRYAQVQEIARQTFYPNATLTQSQSNNLVYRFSLGKAMPEWPAIESALTALALISGRMSTPDFCFLLRSRYFHHDDDLRHSLIAFEVWLRHSRVRSISFLTLSELTEDFIQSLKSAEEQQRITEFLPAFFGTLVDAQKQVQQQLIAAKEHSGYQALGFVDWANLFSGWLALWRWRTHCVQQDEDAVTQQLQKRWETLLEEFSNFGVLQRSVGAQNALNSFRQLVRDSVFMPKSAASPLVISGLLEALGRATDVCFLTGMTQEFPAANKLDPFIPSHILRETSYPEATPQASVEQWSKVIKNLFAATRNAQVSFAVAGVNDKETENQASSLFVSEFANVEVTRMEVAQGQKDDTMTLLQTYTDVTGPAWPSPRAVLGGANIFKHQSQCPFRAFVTHQIEYHREEEPEFGLDYSDRGRLTHRMLELVWGSLASKSELERLEPDQQNELLNQLFDQLLSSSDDVLSADKQQLFRLEKSRVLDLIKEWFEVEQKRPGDFSVVEREEVAFGDWAGIKFKYVIDRVDVTEAGQSVIVDYKTGAVDRKDWQGERLKEPQLPLYALVRDKQKATPVSGIAFAQVRRGDSQYVELSDVDIFRSETKTSSKRQDEWRDAREQWSGTFDRLAQAFLQGDARVDPIDKQVCQHCDLSSVCRVQQFREQTRSSSKPMGVGASK